MNNGNNYEAWKVDEKDFPKDGSIETKIKFLLRYAILAPSTFNTQPWKCIINGNELSILLDFTRVPVKSDKTRRFAIISIGAFIQNTIVASRYFGYDPSINFNSNIKIESKEKILIATMTYKKRSIGNEIQNKELFSAILNRVTNRSLSSDKLITEQDLTILEQLSKKDIKVIILDKTYQKKISSISSLGDSNIWSDISFRKEHVEWVRNNITKKFDGMPAFGVGIGLIPSFFARIVILSPFFAKFQANKNEKTLASSPNYVVLCSKDHPIEWVKVGMLFEHIQLQLTYKGIASGPMGQFIEDTSARKKLMNLTEEYTVLKPQLFFRIGYPTQTTKHSPRFPVERTLISSSITEKLAKMVPVETHEINIGNHRISYITCGKGQPLILIHGLNMGWGQWLANIPELAKHYKVYALDLPGSGQSGKMNFRNLDLDKDYVLSVNKFIEKKDLKKVNIIGHSTGGLIALKLALSNNERVNKIIAIAPLGLIDFVPLQYRLLSFYPFANILSNTVMKPTRKNIKKFLLSAIYDKSRLDNDFLSYYHSYLAEGNIVHPFLLINRITGFNRIKQEFYIANEIKNIKNSTLVIYGEKDPMFQIKKIKNLFISLPNNIILKLFPQTGHVPFSERVNEFNSTVLSFLRATS